MGSLNILMMLSFPETMRSLSEEAWHCIFTNTNVILEEVVLMEVLAISFGGRKQKTVPKRMIYL